MRRTEAAAKLFNEATRKLSLGSTAPAALSLEGASHPEPSVGKSREQAHDPGTISKRATAQAFGRAAELYDSHAELQRQVAGRLLAEARGLGDGLLLDLGCGTGYCARHWQLRQPGARFVCLDLSAGMLQQARSSVEAALVCADAEALPFAPGSFDGLLSSLAIQWCADLPRLFTELRRVLKPNATCHLSTFGPATLQELRSAWAAEDAHVHVNRFADTAELELAIQAAGFRDWSLESERRVRSYAQLKDLQRELKHIGAGNRNPGQPRGLMGKDRLARLEARLRHDSPAHEGFALSWEVLYLRLRA